MRWKGYSSHFVYVCVCVAVTMKSATYLIYTSKTRCHRVLYGTCFQDCVAVAESALFKHFGIICQSPQLSLLLKLPMDKR